jgi:hypothetical protein
MNYGFLVIGIGTVIIVGAIVGIYTTGVMIANLPSEERCQQITGYGSEQLHYAKERFCDYNETGWHFNKTRYREAFSNLENIQT